MTIIQETNINSILAATSAHSVFIYVLIQEEIFCVCYVTLT